jgi:uncharacterized protein (DUF1684 family)
MSKEDLAKYRANKDQYLRTNDHSPIPPQYRSDFAGLPYYDWNPDLAFTVFVSPGDGTPTTIATSDGTDRVYHHAGVVRLPIADQEVPLNLYDTGHPGFFLPFRDATSGKETYGAGRYLDLQPNDDGTVTIDFNLAYSPYCAYSDVYSCALPPAGNWLTVSIEAGEKNWEEPS